MQKKKENNSGSGNEFVASVITSLSSLLAGTLLGLALCPWVGSVKDPRWSNLARLHPIFMGGLGAFIFISGIYVSMAACDRRKRHAYSSGYHEGYDEGEENGHRDGYLKALKERDPDE